MNTKSVTLIHPLFTKTFRSSRHAAGWLGAEFGNHKDYVHFDVITFLLNTNLELKGDHFLSGLKVIKGVEVDNCERSKDTIPISIPPEHTTQYEHWKSIQSKQGNKAAHAFYLTTTHWRNCRKRILDRDGHCCVICHTPATKTKTGYLEVHHRYYHRLWKEHDNDLVSLCNPCHYSIHSTGSISDIPGFIPSVPQPSVPPTPLPQHSRLCCRKAGRATFCDELKNGTRQLPKNRPKGFPRKQWRELVVSYVPPLGMQEQITKPKPRIRRIPQSIIDLHKMTF